jgi:hypothetical protein
MIIVAIKSAKVDVIAFLGSDASNGASGQTVYAAGGPRG